MVEEEGDRDDRTIFVGGLSEKMNPQLLYELFFQAGPIERVAIPKEKDSDRIKTFGFVTYKHLSSVSYAMNIFSGTKLFGKELLLRNRNATANRFRDQLAQQQPPKSLLQGIPAGSFIGNDLNPVLSSMNQQIIQQQLLLLAAGQQNFQHLTNAGAQMFTGALNYDSTRSDNAGSHREHFVDRSRYHREENRSNRSKPYRRSRSRSPVKQQHRHRSSPDRSRYSDKNREKSNYHRWGKR